jgi:HEAT repeat protein
VHNSDRSSAGEKRETMSTIMIIPIGHTLRPLSWPLATLLGLSFAIGCSQKSADQSDQSTSVTRRTTDTVGGSANSALRDQLIMAMSGYEHLVSKAELQSLASTDALVEALTAIYDEPTVRLVVRNRALTSLRFFPTPDAKRALEQAILAAGTPDVVRRTALKAYGAGFGDAAIPTVAKFLDHDDLHTRNAAARSLADLHTEHALAVLRLHLPLEKDSLVKSTIQAGLDRAK